MSFGISATTAIIAGSTALSMASAYSSAQAQNANANMQQANARRRYLMQSQVAGEQMEEQKQLAFEKMTEVSQKFLLAKGRATAIQAESGVAGKTVDRAKALQRTKESIVKGKVAREADVNNINIARGMIANKIDTEALIQEAEANKLSSTQIATNMIIAGGRGAVTGGQFSSQAQSGAYGDTIQAWFSK